MLKLLSLMGVFYLGGLFAPAAPPVGNAGFIGCSFIRESNSDFLVVTYIANKSSASDAGIKVGDSIEAINGVSTRRMALTEARHALEGDIGGEVKLTVRRKGAEEEQISVVRKSLLDTYMSAIDEGDVRAETNLGFFYEHGPASVVDYVQAAKWYKKAADRGDAIGERSLAVLYYYGEGVKQSDQDAFAWFYSAAVQDDPRAEYYLGLIYQNGRGVAVNDESSFYWNERSASHGIGNAQWNLAYAYEKGDGVKKSTAEALKWYRKAQENLPDNDKLKKHIALLSMKAFVENPDSISLDPSVVVTAFGSYLMPLFYFLIGFYVVGGIILFYFSFKSVETPSGIFVALGWLIFQLGGQVVALAALLIEGAALTASSLFIATCLFGAVPVIVSTLGPNRGRLWKASALSWKTLVSYGVGSYVVNVILLAGYGKIYTVLIHSTLPGQPTEVLISKAKHGSVGLAYACIAFALPLTEEILFRGYLFEALQRRFSDVVVVISTAFAFSLVHFQGLYFAPLFGFGLVQGWVRLKTGSLRLPVLLHVMNNGLFIAFSS